MENIDACIVRHDFLHAGESVKQELIELFVFKIVVLDFSRRTLVIHIVRRVSNHKICLLAVHKELVSYGFCTVTADKSVISEQPEVAGFCNARFFQFTVHIKIIIFCVGIIIKERSKFLFIKARQTEVEIVSLQGFNFNFQHFLVPACIESHSVVCDYVRFLLSGRKVIHKNAGNFGDVLGFCGENSSVTCNNIEVPVDYNGIDKPELTQ